MKPKTITKLGAGTLAVVAIASLVGSISGTIAWFQYTTRVTANYTGVVSHMSENLQIRLPGMKDWKSDLSAADIQKYLLDGGRADTALRPVTTGIQSKDGELVGLYKNPIRQYAGVNVWGKAAANHDYIELPLQIRNRDVDGSADSDPTLLSRPIYLTDLTMGQISVTAGQPDISDALRVHFDTGAKQYLVSNHGEAVKAHGELDLDGDYVMDLEEGYGADRKAVDYGVSGTVDEKAKLPLLKKNYYIEYAPGATPVFDPAAGSWSTPTAASTEYHVWDGTKWDVKPTAPTDTENVPVKIGSTITTAEDLAEAKKNALIRVGDVYKVAGTTASGDDGYYRYEAIASDADNKDNFGWVKAAGETAESYKASDILADDSNPNNIVAVDSTKGLTAIGYTYGKAAAVTDLLTNEKSYVKVTTDGTYLLFKDGAWADQGSVKPAGDAFAEVESKAQADRLIANLDNDIYAVGNVLYKWDGTAKKWVVNADFKGTGTVETPLTALPTDPAEGKTYYLNISGTPAYAEGIYRYNNGEFTAVPTTLTINTKIFLEGWQDLAPATSMSTTEFAADYTGASSKAVVVGKKYQVTKSGVVTYHTWDGAGFRNGLWNYDASTGWTETTDTTDVVALTAEADLPTDLLKTGTAVRVYDSAIAGHDVIYRWTGTDWVEGGTPIWDAAAYVGKSFEVGFRFSTPTHFDHN